MRTLVAQGCIPIGEPWTITESEGPIIHTIAGRPALDVLVDTLEALRRRSSAVPSAAARLLASRWTSIAPRSAPVIFSCVICWDSTASAG